MMATGPELTRSGRNILEAAGWLTFTMNWPKAAPRGMVGFPDIIAFRDNHTILLEIKGAGDSLKPKDEQFAADISNHEGTHLQYLVCRDEADFWRVVNWR